MDNETTDVPWAELIWDTYYGSSAPQATKACGSFWWRDVLKLYDKFCQLFVPKVHSGEPVLFWLDHWQLQGRNTPMKDRCPRLHSFVLDDMLTVKPSMIYHPWSVTCTSLSPLKPVMSWFSWSPSCHRYLSMLRARTFSTGQPKLVNFDPRYIITLLIGTLLWIQLLSVYGSVPARSRSKSLVGYSWWIGLTQEIWCKADIGLCKMILVVFARLSHMRIEHICSFFFNFSQLELSWDYLGIIT